jgi:hypothetical protein
VYFPSKQQVRSDAYQVTFGRRIGPLIARQVCVTALKAPAEKSTQKVRFALLGNTLITQTLTVATPAYPAVKTAVVMSAPVAASEPLVLDMSQDDKIFDYVVSVNNQQQTCTKVVSHITCPIHTMGVTQGQSYPLSLKRVFGKQLVGEVFNGTVKIADPVIITEASIGTNTMVYTVPTELRLKTNKPVVSFDQLTLTQGEGTAAKTINVQATTVGNEVVVRLPEPLAREAKFTLKLAQARAADKGQLAAPYELRFTTSGGPKVLSVNIGTYRVATTQTVQITFDQALLPGQDLAGLVQLAGIPASITVSGNKVIIDPLAALPKCVALNITIKAGLKSAYGIVGTTPWAYNSRATCVTVFSLGTSVRGRDITAYSFGSGPSKVLYVGTTHGNEKSSKYLLDAWIDELETNPGRIPANRTIVIVPNLNPDAFVSGGRTNAHNVDLNRNFPANDWQTGIYMPGPVFLAGGGGSSALSEPESAAIASYIQSSRPRLVMTYHSEAAAVIANGSGDSAALAALYATKSRYSNKPDSAADALFGYPTTGEMEDWLHDKLGTPALLVELSGNTNPEFTRNRDALWAMATLP